MLTDIARAKYEIEQFLCQSDRWQCHQDGIPSASMTSHNLAVTVEFGKLIFSYWGEDFAESWRIEGYRIRGHRLCLDLSRRMGRERLHMELRLPGEADPLTPDVIERRRRFQELMCRWVKAQFPRGRIERVSTRRDDRRQLSGKYTRLLLAEGQRRFAVIGVNAQEDPSAIDGLLTAAIIWYDRISRQGDRKPDRLLLLAPVGRAMKLARRLTVITPPHPLRMELYEVDERWATAKFMRPFDQGALFDASGLRLPRPEGPIKANPLRDRLLEDFPELTVYRRPGSSMESLRLRGLEVARLRGERVYYGVGAKKQRLEGTDLAPLMTLIHQVRRLRCPESPQRWHPFYRQQAERWLEEIIREDIRVLDVRLDPRIVYPQIPAYGDDEYGLVDLLAITEQGRVVIVELKVTEDVELPMQGVDYWLKMEWHRRRGDFRRRGYFPGKTIADQPALLFLVSPLLRFHRTFDVVARWIDARVPVYKVGINDTWRQGVRVLLKERIHG